MNLRCAKIAKLQGIFPVPFILLFLTIVCVCSTSLAHANKVYLTPRMYNVIWSDASVKVFFNADEALCRKNYGDDWKQKCTTWLGKAGTAPQGIETQGWPQGEWIWENSTTLRFTPSEFWTKNTTYTLDLTQLPLPARVQLSTTKPSFYTIPLSAQMGQAKVWIDPSPKAEHALSFAMRFSANIDETTRLSLQDNVWPKALGDSGLRLGPGKWVWLDDNTRAVVNARILSLPEKKSNVSLTLPGIRPLWLEGNSWHFPQRDAVKELTVPGTASLFTLENAKLETWQNKALQMEQHLVFRFSQRVKAQDFLKALTVLELPVHRSKENIKPSNWREGKVGPDSRQKARALQPEWVRLPDESDDVLRFRLNASPGKYILWNVAAGFGPTNDQGVKTPLAQGLEGVEFVPLGTSRLEFLQAGTVLMQQSDVALVSEHLDSIRWSAHRFMDNALALPFLYSLDETLSQEQRNATAEVTRGEIMLSSSAGTTQGYGSTPVFSTLKAKDIFGFHKESQAVMPGLVYLHLEGIKDGRVITSSGRMLMHSGMALVLKTLPNENIEAYVGALDTAQPLADVRVQVIGYNGVPVAEVKTDAKGKAVLPDLSALHQEKRPVAVVARRMTDNKWNFMGLNEPYMEDMLWLSLQDYARYVNLSNFAHINGKQSSTNTLNAFVFAQRGLFRPGEALHFGALLRANDWKLLPSAMPLVASIQDEVGRIVFEQEFKAQENIHSFTWNIPSNALTGRYSLHISTPAAAQDGHNMGLVLGSSSVRVENFLPDTLRLQTKLVQAQGAKQEALSTKGWLVTSSAASQEAADVALQVQLDTLFGQVAAGRRITSVMHLRPAYLHFDGYEEYTFQDVSPYFSKGTDPITRPLKSTLTDVKGQALIPLDFSQWRFGTLQCSINTEGYESGGGRAVNFEKRFLLSPMPFMLGFKTGEGADNKNFILKDSAAKLQFQAIDSQLNTVNPGALLFSIARRHTVQSLVSDALGQYTYAETPLSTEIAQSEQVLSAQGDLTWNIPTQEVGDYVLTVKMAPEAGQSMPSNATVLAHISYSIVGNDDLRPALQRAQHLPKAHLHIKTDKTYYEGGENAQIMVTAPYDGVALISLERDSVAAHAWVKLPVGSSLHTLPIPKDFSGRAYVQVLMGRAAQSENIFLQPQSVAVASITVNTKQRELPLQVSADKKVLPGKSLHWRIENTQGEPIKAVLFAVDEGILQLSRYNTPNPLYHLLLDRALEVRTAQLFDRLMPESNKIMQRLSAFGGGGEEDASFRALLGSFQNPFKRKHEPPMTWWSGVVEVPAAGLDVEVPIPEYFNGTVRLMAVAHNAQGVGHGEARVIVQDTQVLIPQTPTTVSLGDSFEGGLSIANTTDAPMTLRTSLHLDAQSTTEDVTLSHFAEQITLAPHEEKYLSFQGKVGNTPGVAVLRFGTEDAQGIRRERSYPISVRPATLPRHSQHSFILNQSTQVHTRRNLLPYEAQSSLTLSPIPLPLLQSSLQYLHNYPYDCVEQSVSKAFPLALLNKSPLNHMMSKNLTFLQGKNKEETLENAQNALVAAFRPMQGMSLWTHWTEISTLLTAYAADYVLTLQDAGLSVPPGMMPQLFIALEKRINESPASVEDLRALAYASWVLARAGYVVSKQLELCENYIRRHELAGSDVYNSLMAGAYAALYMRSDAQRHLDKVLGEAPKQWRSSSEMFDTLAQHGLHAQVLAKHFPQEFQKNIPFLQESLLEGLNKAHATMGASMAALGLIHMVDGDAEVTADLQGVELLCGMYEQDIPATEPTAQLFRQFYTLDAPGCTRFDVQMPAGQKYFAHMGAYGFDMRMPTKALEQGLVVRQSITLEDETPFNGTLLQGQVVRVDVDVHLLKNASSSVAVVSLLPGGFELVLDHKDDTSSSKDISITREDDRVICFVDAARKAKRITYHMRAVTQGSFALPAVQAEGLFDTTLQSHTVGGRVHVVAP